MRHENHAVDPSGEPQPPTAIEFDLLCPSCSYNLRGLTSNCCPECGLNLDEVRSGESSIPWVHRKSIGWYRAYWKTVWFVATKRRRLSAEMARPVSYRDAQRFRWMTIAHAYLPILVTTILLYAVAPGGWTAPGNPFPWPMQGFMKTNPPWPALAFSEYWPMALLHTGILFWLAAATGVSAYFFHPRDMPLHIQNRAVALSYYANAALAWTTVQIVPNTFLLVVFKPDNDWSIVLMLIGLTLLAFTAVAWYTDTLYLSCRVIPNRRQRKWALAISLPVLWLVLAVIIIPGVPGLVIGVLVVIESVF